MVKAGVFLLVRLWPAMGGTNEWLWLVGSAGLITFILGAFLAVFQQDLKGLLAYSTISHLGLITLLTGLDTPFGQIAAIFHIMNHATFKASLFMAAGIIDHETGTRDIRRLSGLWAFMPITATLAMVAAAAMAGVPLLNGFLSKEMFFAETIEIHDNSLVDQALPYIVTLASMFTVAYSLRFIRDVFFGPAPTDLPRTPHEPPVPDAVSGRASRPGMPRRRCRAGPHRGADPRYGGAGGSRRGDAGVQPSSLARLHPRTPDEHRRDGRGRGRVRHAALLSAHARGTAPAAPHQWPADLRLGLVTLSWRLARWLEDNLGTRRLQPQLQLLAGAAFVAALMPLYARGLVVGGSPHGDLDLGFRTALGGRDCLRRWAPPVRPSFIALRR